MSPTHTDKAYEQELKDLRDRLGDAAFGKPTLLLRLGKRATCVVSVGGAALGTAILIATLSRTKPLSVRRCSGMRLPKRSR